MKAQPLPPTRKRAHFGPPTATTEVVEQAKPVKAKIKREKKKADPKLVAAARELRDRWLEHVNRGGASLAGDVKHDLRRALPADDKPLGLLPAA